MINVSYLNLLGISFGYTNEQLKTAFRKKAKEIHPDVNSAPDAKKRFQELNRIYEELLATPVHKRAKPLPPPPPKPAWKPKPATAPRWYPSYRETVNEKNQQDMARKLKYSDEDFIIFDGNGNILDRGHVSDKYRFYR